MRFLAGGRRRAGMVLALGRGDFRQVCCAALAWLLAKTGESEGELEEFDGAESVRLCLKKVENWSLR